MARKTTKTKKDTARHKPSKTRAEAAGQKRYIQIEEPSVHEIYQKHVSRKPTDGFAIAAFVCGLLGFLIPFLNVAAIVLGIIAIHNIHKHKRRKGHGLAVIGMLLGLASLLLVLIADVASVAGFLLFG